MNRFQVLNCLLVGTHQVVAEVCVERDDSKLVASQNLKNGF
jgi:hypothetical protein